MLNKLSLTGYYSITIILKDDCSTVILVNIQSRFVVSWFLCMPNTFGWTHLDLFIFNYQSRLLWIAILLWRVWCLLNTMIFVLTSISTTIVWTNLYLYIFQMKASLLVNFISINFQNNIYYSLLSSVGFCIIQ